MATRSSRRIYSFFFLILLVTAVSCQQHAAPPAQGPDVFPVSFPVQKDVTDYVDFTGRTDAVNSVNIVARVTGYLVKMPFQEGADVKAGELLFVVDPRPYQAQLEQAQSQVNLYQAQLDLAKTTYKRYQELDKTKPGAVSKQLLDQYSASVVEAEARMKAYEKSLEVYKLNKEFTQVVSPIDGQVSRYYLTLGNLVNQDQTLLTTVVSMDPLYAYFDMDERNLLRIRQAINDGRLKSRRPSAPVTPQQIAAVFGIAAANASAPAWPALVDTTVAAAPEQFNDIPVLLGLPGEDGYPHQGIINFANNQVNPSTGSISVRGLFGNPKPANGVRLMSPGMFVRIRLPIGPPHPAILVIDRAIQSDQGKKYVYIVGPDNKTRRSKELVTGALQPDGLRVIMSGLQPTDRVVVSKIQQVRDNMEVQVQEVDMPSFSEAGGPARPAGGNN